MPVHYTGIIDEHLAVRERVGVFDISHMGEIAISGQDAIPFADYLVTNSISGMRDGDVKYSPLCHPSGGQVDDIFVYKVNERQVLLVVNASPEYSVKDYDWIESHTEGFDVTVTNCSRGYGGIALQGPLSAAVLDPLLEAPVAASHVKRFTFVEGTVAGSKGLVSRTGYTGEDGFEIYCDADDVVSIWGRLLEEGRRYDIRPCGLGARDTLRFEVCYWLYGNDIDETTYPLETGQSWSVKFEKGDFIGKEALVEARREGLRRRLAGVFVPTGGIARNGMEVTRDGTRVGRVTSGNYCPSLKKVYAMAMIDLPHDTVGNTLAVNIRGRNVAAEVVEMPFLLPFNKR